VTVETFYDELAPFYHLIFPDWEASIQRQAGFVQVERLDDCFYQPVLLGKKA
jgi:hypothetical protein